MKAKFGLRLPRLSRFLHTMRFRLSLWYLAVLALALLVFGVTIYSIEERTLSAAIDTELGAVADPVAKVIATQNGQFRLPDQFGAGLQQLAGAKLPQNVLGGLENLPGVKSLLTGRYVVMLVDAQGKVTQQFGAVSPGDVSRITALAIQAQNKAEPTSANLELGDKSDPTQSLENNNTYRLELYPVKDAATGKISGTLVLGLWWEGAATLQSLFWTLVLSGLGVLALSAGGGYWLASRAIRPVNKIRRTAQSISETDLSRRINLKSQDELGELAATFDGMLDRLENAFERQRQFTADASHELRTPLTIINLEVNRLLRRRRSAEEYERTLSIIQSENEYMTRLVNDLLTLARADSGQVKIQAESIDLSDLALEVVERLAPLTRQNEIELLTGELPELEINGDRLYLTRMLANLVENGIKYTAGKGKTVIVETGVTRAKAGVERVDIQEKAGWAWIRVRDDGPGIAPEHLPFLFNRFYQADKARGTDGPASPETPDQAQIASNLRGSGLGLAIVQWVAELHQGRVKVESEPGKGSTFEVWLPLAKGSL